MFVHSSALFLLVTDPDRVSGLRRAVYDSYPACVYSSIAEQVLHETLDPAHRAQAERLFGGPALVELQVSAPIIERAEVLNGHSVSWTDAVELATAVLVRPAVTAFVCTDLRTSRGARDLGLITSQPD